MFQNLPSRLPLPPYRKGWRVVPVLSFTTGSPGVDLVDLLTPKVRHCSVIGRVQTGTVDPSSLLSSASMTISVPPCDDLPRSSLVGRYGGQVHEP